MFAQDGAVVSGGLLWLFGTFFEVKSEKNVIVIDLCFVIEMGHIYKYKICYNTY